MNSLEKYLARHLWWLSGVAVWASFNVILMVMGQFPRYFRFPGNDWASVVMSGNEWFSFVVIVSSASLFLARTGVSRWRAVRLGLLGSCGSLIWGGIGFAGWKWEVWTWPFKFPTEPLPLLFVGLPLVWSFGVLLAGLMWRPRAARED